MGTHSYSGTLATGVRILNDPQLELGHFTLTADFGRKTYTFTGETYSDTIEGAGVLNTATGAFLTTNMQMTTSGTSRAATMYGQFHGASAQSVAGVFHSNEASPEYAGAFVGSR